MFAAFSPHGGVRITTDTPIPTFDFAMGLVGVPSINPAWWVGQVAGCRALITAAGAPGLAEPITGTFTVAVVELRRHLRAGLRLTVDHPERTPTIDGSTSREPDIARALFSSQNGEPSVITRCQGLRRAGWTIEIADTCLVARTALYISAPDAIEALVDALARIANELADRRDALGATQRDRARAELLLRAGAPLNLLTVSPDGVLFGEVSGLSVGCTYDDLTATCAEVRVTHPAPRPGLFRITAATGLVPGFLADDVSCGNSELDRKLDIRCTDRLLLGEVMTPELGAALLRLRDLTHGFAVTAQGVSIRHPEVPTAEALTAMLAAAIDVTTHLGPREGSAYR